MSQNPAGNIVHRLHALDLTNGSELCGGPTTMTMTATYPGTGGNRGGGVVTFLPQVHHERAALPEAGSTIYTAWAGRFGDCGAYSAWVIAYDAGTLKQTSAIDLGPNNSGSGMWMGGGGPAADAAGNVYVISADTPGTNHSYGNSFVRLSASGGLTVGDYFTPYNTSAEEPGGCKPRSLFCGRRAFHYSDGRKRRGLCRHRDQRHRIWLAVSCDGHAGFLAAIHRIFPSRSDRDRRAAADRRGIFRKAPGSSPLLASDLTSFQKYSARGHGVRGRKKPSGTSMGSSRQEQTYFWVLRSSRRR